MSTQDLIKERLECLGDNEFIINMGPQHPSTHGVLRLILRLDGEQIVEAYPDMGFLHRSIEKMCENRTYLQILPLTDRLDYLASMNNNWVWCMVVEEMLQIEVPPRAQYLRGIMTELNRIASHLLSMGIFAMDLGAVTMMLYGFRERELIMDLFEMTCGQRLTYNYMRFGGVSQDIPPEFYQACKEFCKVIPSRLDEYETILIENEIFLERLRGVGTIDAATCADYGVTGPNIRAAGVPHDLRVTRPYGPYGDLKIKPMFWDEYRGKGPGNDLITVMGHDGDTWERYYMRIIEMRESARMVERLLDGLPEGEIRGKAPKAVRPPEGECIARIEGPRGDYYMHCVSDGSLKPYRVKIRCPSFGNLAVLAHAITGWKIADVVAIFGSLDVILPEVDR
jgi:NADH-quinone oxidoreductase subunit D